MPSHPTRSPSAGAAIADDWRWLVAEKTWKMTERTIAKRLGGERLPVNGRGNQPDVQTPWLAIEVKHRKALPGWLKDAVRQAVARGGRKLPLVVLHEHGASHGEDIVCLRLADFMDWFGAVSP